MKSTDNHLENLPGQPTEIELARAFRNCFPHVLRRSPYCDEAEAGFLADLSKNPNARRMLAEFVRRHVDDQLIRFRNDIVEVVQEMAKLDFIPPFDPIDFADEVIGEIFLCEIAFDPSIDVSPRAWIRGFGVRHLRLKFRERDRALDLFSRSRFFDHTRRGEAIFEKTK